MKLKMSYMVLQISLLGFGKVLEIFLRSLFEPCIQQVTIHVEYISMCCWLCGNLALFQYSFFCWTENQCFEEIYKLRDIFELTMSIHFKKQPHQAAMKAKQLVHWSFLCRGNL